MPTKPEDPVTPIVSSLVPGDDAVSDVGVLWEVEVIHGETTTKASPVDGTA